MKKELIGEVIGTFILVFIGCGSVIAAVMLGWLNSLYEVAAVWGIGVAAAIYASWKICPAHLNPAVSVAMTISGDLPLKKLPSYTFAQLIGGMLAALALYLIFSNSIAQFELENNIIRGERISYKSAQVFGEFFPNPGFEDTIQVNVKEAVLLEAIGTAILLIVIYFVTSIPKLKPIVPLLIGATITSLIIFIAPFTQAGFNPARDFGPRLIAYFMGWGKAAFPPATFSFFTVYIIGPIIGASIIGAGKRIINK